MARIPQIIYALKCGHGIRALATMVSGEFYCPWHQGMSPIKDVVVYEWRAKCTRCTYARWAGLDKGTADIFCMGHYRRNPGHAVNSEYVTNPDALRTKVKFDAWNSQVAR